MLKKSLPKKLPTVVVGNYKVHLGKEVDHERVQKLLDDIIVMATYMRYEVTKPHYAKSRRVVFSSNKYSNEHISFVLAREEIVAVEIKAEFIPLLENKARFPLEKVNPIRVLEMVYSEYLKRYNTMPKLTFDPIENNLIEELEHIGVMERLTGRKIYNE